MKNLSPALKRGFLVAGLLMIAAVLVYKPAGAGENGTTPPTGGSDVSLSAGTRLRITLTPSLSLDLRLSSIETRQAPDSERQSYVPPILIPKASELGSDRYRLGVGLNFRFWAPCLFNSQSSMELIIQRGWFGPSDPIILRSHLQ